MDKIEKILCKKRLNGKELGQLLIASLVNDINETGENLVTQERFSLLEKTLNKEDIDDYIIYTKLYEAISSAYDAGLNFKQQFYNGFYKLLNYLTDASRADDSQKAISRIPLIVTQSQYNRLVNKTRERLGTKRVSYFDLLGDCLFYFSTDLENAPRTIRRRLNDLKKLPAKNYTLATKYCEIMNIGYYQLPDGTRSDKVSSEEWQLACKAWFIKRHAAGNENIDYDAAVDEFRKERILTLYRLLYEGAPAIKDFYEKNTGEILPEEKEKELYYSLVKLSKAVGDVNENPTASKLLPYLGYDESGEWHYRKKIPDELSAFHLLIIYADIFKGDCNTIDKREAYATFKKEMPELHFELDYYIREHIKPMENVKGAMYEARLISKRELASLNFLHYSDDLKQPNIDLEIVDTYLIENESHEATNRTRAFQGFAIIKNPYSWQVDNNGDYIEEPLLKFAGQDIYELSSEDNINAIRTLKETLVEPVIRYYYAFNEIIKLLAEEYDVPFLKSILLPIQELKDRISGYNDMLYVFYNNPYGNEYEQAKKKKLIKQVFEPLEVDCFAPSKSIIASVRVMIRRAKRGKYDNRVIDSVDNIINQVAESTKKGADLWKNS